MVTCISYIFRVPDNNLYFICTFIRIMDEFNITLEETNGGDYNVVMPTERVKYKPRVNDAVAFVQQHVRKTYNQKVPYSKVRLIAMKVS